MRIAASMRCCASGWDAEGRIAVDPPTASRAVVSRIVAQAVARHREGDLAAAERLYREALAFDDAAFDPNHLLGVVLHQQGDHEAAVQRIGRAIAVRADDPAAHANLALALRKLGRLGEALASVDRALALAPDHGPTLNTRGNLLRDLGRGDEALACYDCALASNPRYVMALRNRGDALLALQRPAEALADFERAADCAPGDAEAHQGRGNALAALGRPDDALAAYGRVLALQPGHADALNNRGHVLLAQQRPAEALEHFERALASRPSDAGILANAGIAQVDLGRPAEALARFDAAVRERPGFADGWFNRGGALLELKRYDEAAASFARVVELARDYPLAEGQRLHAKMLGCDWEGVAPLLERVREGVRAGRRAIEPFAFQGLADDPQELLSCAITYASARFPAQPTRALPARPAATRVPTIGYVCGEFREHATSLLMAGVWEAHDRERFRIVAFDNGHDDGSALRRRILGAFDDVIPIGTLDDARAAATVREHKVDILVDLNGYYGLGRQGLFAHRPAPLQVNYLGFPGTLGAAYYDYLVADRHVVPPGEERHYVERVVRLPHCYQANDDRRRVDDRVPTRAEAGLPERGFVFCCFNNSYKILPQVFDVWTRLLGRIEGSVMWLFASTTLAARHLRSEAQRRGIAPDRLVFAPPVAPSAHLARHRLADLVLDTLPYNAHTTGSDALWMGVPIVTCRGHAFAGRVGASLLHAAGLPELVTSSLAEYEALAARLASEAGELSEVRAKLLQARSGSPLFDTRGFTRHLEAAFAGMWERHARGEPPAPFDVPA